MQSDTLKNLKELIDIQNGFAYRSSEYSDSGYFVVRITNVQDGFITLNNPKYIKNTQDTFVLNEGDLLMSLTGNVGRVGFVLQEYLPAVLNQRVARFIVKNGSRLDKKYLFYFLNSDITRDKICGLGKGMAQKNVSTKDIENLEIPLPPLDEQRRIVARLERDLGKIAEAKRLRAEAIAATESLLPAELHKIFEEGKAKGWEEKPLGEVTSMIQYGHTASAKDNGNAKMLRITDIQDGGVNWGTVPFCECEAIGKYKLIDRDIVFARTGATVGKSYLIINPPDNSVFASYLIRVRVNEKIVLPKYVHYFFQSPNYWHQISKNMVGGAQPNVNGAKLKKLLFPLPPITEQKEIVARVDALVERINTLRARQEASARELEALEKSVLAQAFKVDD